MNYGIAIFFFVMGGVATGAVIAGLQPASRTTEDIVARLEAAQTSVTIDPAARIKKDAARLIPFECPAGSREVMGPDGDVSACEAGKAGR